MKNIKKIIIDSWDEVRHKVVWPSYKSLQESSLVVLSASIIFAIVIGFIDLGLRNSVSWFYKI